MSNNLYPVIPEDFPLDVYNKILNRVDKKYYPVNTIDSLGEQFYDAWQAVGYRFFTCVEHDIAFTASIERAGSRPAERMEHYIQERELYGFFVTGLTIIESFYYGCYIIAAIIDSIGFPVDRPEKIKVDETADRYLDNFPEESITHQLDNLRKDVAYKDWKNTRNILAHRTTPQRVNEINLWPSQTNPTVGVTWSTDKILLNKNTTTIRRTWLAATVTRLICELDTFTENKSGRLPFDAQKK
jgi:hypothetical protein